MDVSFSLWPFLLLAAAVSSRTPNNTYSQQARVAALNRRFASFPGVLVHSWEGFGLPSLKSFTAGPHPMILAGSMFNSRLPYLFKGRTHEKKLIAAPAGIVISENAFEKSLLCSYYKDGGSSRIQCTGSAISVTCVPGCIGPHMGSDMRRTSNRTWCKKGVTNEMLLAANCPHKPTELHQMLELQEKYVRHQLDTCKSERIRTHDPKCQCLADCCTWPECQFYNEVVLLASELKAPRTIDAIFFFVKSASASDADFQAGRAAAKSAYVEIQKWGGTNTKGLPMLVGLNPKSKTPFTLASTK